MGGLPPVNVNKGLLINVTVVSHNTRYGTKLPTNVNGTCLIMGYLMTQPDAQLDLFNGH
jgi:hypothetical protein